MEPGEYLTNVLSFSNFASINYEYFEPQGLSPGIARKLLQRLEASWRQEGRLVHCDTFRDAIWTFQNASNTSTDSPIAKSPSTETNIVEVQGIRLVSREKGIFEPASLARSKQASPNALNTPNSSSSPSSSLEANIRNAQALNARATQGNAAHSAMQEPLTPSPGLKPPIKPEDIWPSMREVHEGFISAVLGSLVYFLCRDELFVPLNSRTLILNPSKPLNQGGFAGRSLQVANAITLATLDISLTSLGTLVVKAHSDTASGLQSLVDATGASNVLAPGAALWLAPGGNAAKFYGTPDDRNLPASSSSQLQASASDSRLNSFTEASIKAWQSKCLEWLSAKGINTPAIESGGWLFVQVLGGHSLYSKTEHQGIPILEGLTVVPWPAVLCFQTSSSSARDSQANGKLITGTRDPVSFAENWFTGKDERASIMLKRQKERQIAEARSKEQADVEARNLQSATYSPAALRRGSNAGAMYPTPPDAIHHPIGATPSFDGAGSTPGNLNPFISQEPGTAGQANSGIGMSMGMADGDAEMWGSSVKKERAISNAHFNEGEGDAENLFSDIGGDLFGTITDADFSFFDEPDAVPLEPKAPEVVDLKPAIPNAPPEEPQNSSIPNTNGMNAPDTVMRDQNEPSRTAVEKAKSPETKDIPSAAAKSASKTVDKPPPTERHVFKPPVDPPFNQEAIYKRLTHGPQAPSQKGPERRASLFDKVDFERALSSIDKKYGTHGQFNFPLDKKSIKRPGAVTLPQTDYLSNRKRVQNPESVSSSLARIWMNEESTGKVEPTEQMDFLMDSDGLSQMSEQDDTSHTTDDPSFLPKLGLDRNWLAENGQGDGLTASFDPMAIDFEQSASTPQSMSGSQIPLLDADPADWSLTTYFTSPEPDVQLDNLSDFDRIATAQILADQAVSGTLQLPKVSGNDTPLRPNKCTTTRELMRSITKAAKFYFKEITTCTMRSFLDIQGIPVSNQGLRLPPRPINPRGPNPLDPRSHNPFPLPPPQLEVRRSDSKLSILPPAINFWENLALSPSRGAKDINAVCVFPNIDGIVTSANTLLEQMRSVYESFRLGSHERVASKDLVDGLMSFSFDSNQKGSPNLVALQQTVIQLCKALVALPTEEKNLVVYFVYPVDNAPLLVHICSSFQSLFNVYRKNLLDRKTKTYNELVLQLIPLDFIASPTSIVAPSPSEYARLAMEVYDRCVDFTSSSSSPGIMLEQPLPKSIDFKLNPTPSASVLQENTCLHIAYAQSIDDRWITAVWTDNRGTQQMTASYCLGRKNEPISRPFSEIANEIWETTLDFISHKKIHWRVMIARVGVMDPSEMDFWVGLASTEANAQVNLTLITVQTDPSLRLLPPALTLTPNGNSAQSTTPVSTPQQSIVSPENTTTPARDGNAATPHEPFEPDADARLIDYTDQSWGAVLSHRLNNSNSLLELNPALISGYLIKRGGTNSDDPPIIIEVNIVHSEVVGNPRTFHESLLREILGYYRGLATLARVRGVVDPVRDGRPWHIAAAEKAVKALYMLM